jgi:N-acetylglucosamine-6-phosphate deacetylase
MAVAVHSVAPVHMRIAHNVIRDNGIGVCLTDTVAAVGLGTNAYKYVGSPVVVEPAN